jgi:hypothetical protein
MRHACILINCRRVRTDWASRATPIAAGCSRRADVGPCVAGHPIGAEGCVGCHAEGPARTACARAIGSAGAGALNRLARRARRPSHTRCRSIEVVVPCAKRASRLRDGASLAVEARRAWQTRRRRRRCPGSDLLRARSARALRYADALVWRTRERSARTGRALQILAGRACCTHEATCGARCPRRARSHVDQVAERAGFAREAGAIERGAPLGQNALAGRAVGVRRAGRGREAVMVPAS